MIGVTNDGATVVVAAGQGRSGGEGTGTVAYSAKSGARRWAVDSIDTASRVYTLLGFEPALAMGRGRVYVSSNRGQHAHMSYVTEAHDTRNGDLVWSARFSGGTSYASGIAVDPKDERVFVTGMMRTVNGDFVDPGIESYDILTIAYRARGSAAEGGKPL